MNIYECCELRAIINLGIREYTSNRIFVIPIEEVSFITYSIILSNLNNMKYMNLWSTTICKQVFIGKSENIKAILSHVDKNYVKYLR